MTPGEVRQLVGVRLPQAGQEIWNRCSEHERTAAARWRVWLRASGQRKQQSLTASAKQFADLVQVMHHAARLFQHLSPRIGRLIKGPPQYLEHQPIIVIAKTLYRAAFGSRRLHGRRARETQVVVGTWVLYRLRSAISACP